MLAQELKALSGRANNHELRKFGKTLGIFFALVAAFLFWKESDFAQLFAIVAAIFLILAFIGPLVLKPVYLLWMGFATIMGFFMTRVILLLLYSIVFVPAGLAIRLLGKDPLNQRIDPGATSYWIMRERKAFVPESAEKQY